jgi:FAD/FMN-containing dehydrogenase
MPEAAAAISPDNPHEMARLLAFNAESNKYAVYPTGGIDVIPGDPNSITFSASALNQIIDYSPRDMVITAGAGCSIAMIQEALQHEHQCLPIDIDKPATTTLGGAIAANLFGSRAWSCGTFRDSLIGMEAVSGDGRIYHAGGKVVKNVAGYDLCKLMVGSRGVFGIATQFTLQVRPIPEARVTYTATISQTQLHAVWKLSLAPDAGLAGFACSTEDEALTMRFEFQGFTHDCEAQAQHFGRQLQNLGIVLHNEHRSAEIVPASTGSVLALNLKTAHVPQFFDYLQHANQLDAPQQNFWSQCRCVAYGIGRILISIPADTAFPAYLAKDIKQKLGHTLTLITMHPAHASSDMKLCPISEQDSSALPLLQKLRQTFDPALVFQRGRYRLL